MTRSVLLVVKVFGVIPKLFVEESRIHDARVDTIFEKSRRA